MVSRMLILVGLALDICQAQTYTVNIRVGDQVWRDGGQEWVTDMYAELYLNGNPVPPSASYFYEWRFLRNGQWSFWLNGRGYGIDHVQGDGEIGWSAPTTVTVTGATFSAVSEITTVGKGGEPKQVYIYAKRENGVDINTSGQHAFFGHWGGETWRARAASAFFQDKFYQLTLGEQGEYLSSQPFAISAIGEKFHFWNSNQTDVLNHKQFMIEPFTNDLTSRHKPIHGGTTVRASLIDVPGIDGGEIDFSDPWLTDFKDAARANRYRNRGIQAPLKRNPSPILIEQNFGGHDTTYKGVFLNQDYNIPGNPYYSVGAPNPNTIGGFESYFVNWDNANPSQVEFQNSNAAQTGVVFKQSGATATAKYKAHLASSLATATSTNSQRKYAADIFPSSERSAICYESAGQVWVSDKLNSFGEPFSPEQLVSTGVGSFSQPSILVANGGIPPLGAGSETAPQVAVVYQKDDNRRNKYFFLASQGNLSYHADVHS